MLIDDRLDCCGAGVGCPEAQRLRETGVMWVRHYFTCAKMVDAAAIRSPRAMLESLRDGRKLYLEVFPDDPTDDLLAEFAATEVKLMRLMELESRRLA